jgi:hypothetical protein
MRTPVTLFYFVAVDGLEDVVVKGTDSSCSGCGGVFCSGCANSDIASLAMGLTESVLSVIRYGSVPEVPISARRSTAKLRSSAFERADNAAA